MTSHQILSLKYDFLLMTVCYREIKDEEDKMKLQRDIDRLGSWARKWDLRF